MAARDILVAGAGILGLWQALTLARAGHRVRLIDSAADPFAINATRHAGAMLSPDCEGEAAPDLVRDHGRQGLTIWRGIYPGLVNTGTLVVAAARDRGELARFQRMTRGHVLLDEHGVDKTEPDLKGRFTEALHFADEAHMTTPEALSFLLQAVRDTGADVQLGSRWQNNPSGKEIVIDCRGMASRSLLASLRGVRGERMLVRTGEIRLLRPVRLLHPRHPIYVVPWSENRFLVGATMIESEDGGAVSVRSALELLGAAYVLHPAFGEAEIVEMSTGVRPAFPDNVPRALVREHGRRILVNGAYRHGFLLAPVLASAVADYIETGRAHPLLIEENR
jgi:glycine oxidase